MSPVHLICCWITLMAGKLTGCGTMLPISTNLPPRRTMSSPSTVAAAPVGQLLHALHARLGRREFVHVDHVGRAALLRELQAQRLLVDRDDFRGALLGGDRRRVDAEAARALDGDDVTELHARVLEPVQHLAHGAVHRRNCFVRQDVGHLEDVVAGRQEVVLGVAAVAVWVLVQRELHAPALAMRADVMLAARAPVAAIARIEERKGDAVAFLQRLAERIRRDALAEARHHTRELVARNPAHVGPGVVAVIAPVVEVRSTDGGGGVLDEYPAGLDLRGRQSLELERLSRLVEYDGQSLLHGVPSSVDRSPAQGPAGPYRNRCRAAAPAGDSCQSTDGHVRTTR